MSSNQRLDVWRGTRAKTTGGLTKAMLTKNKRGKIVSKKKSQQAGAQNNLGQYLRQKGKKVPKDEMLHKKGGAKAAVSKNKPKKAQPKAVPKKKPVPKPKPPAAKLKKAAAGKPKKKPKVVRKKSQNAPKGKVNPLTKQPYDKNSKGKVSLDNVKRTKLRRVVFARDRHARRRTRLVRP